MYQVVKLLEASTSSARILVNERVEIEFKEVNGSLMKAGTTVHDRGTTYVPRAEYRDAVRLAYASIRSRKEQEKRNKEKEAREPKFV